jgi:2-polyprenyl-3-methyl-5-hydroxy-6-metoxy-1,4-benzoquinol methylase
LTTPRPELKDLGKYYESENYISHSKKANSIVDKLYMVSRVYALNWKWSLVRATQTTDNFKLLDYGCGAGSFLEKSQSKGASINGVEPSKNARAIAEEITGSTITSNLENLNQKFDAITLWHVLEHVPDLIETVNKLKACLEENGTMFIAVPNHISNDAIKYKEYWAAYDVPRHLWHFNPTSMTRLLANANLKIENIVPMKLDALYVGMLSEKYKNGKQTISTFAKGILNGLISNVKANSNEYSSLIYVIKK